MLAVGGTSLTIATPGAYVGETAWNGSGGGPSQYEAKPSYQSSTPDAGKRTTPDVAYNADPNTGYYVYDSVRDSSGEAGWFAYGGTSAGAPQWSALIALADQGRAAEGLGALTNAAAAVYSLPAGDFHDVTSGGNGYSAAAGYDLATGRGSPRRPGDRRPCGIRRRLVQPRLDDQDSQAVPCHDVGARGRGDRRRLRV